MSASDHTFEGLTLNIDLLRQMVKWAEEEDAAAKETNQISGWDQSEWASVSLDKIEAKIEALDLKPDDEDEYGWKDWVDYPIPAADMLDCGTAFCIAGRVCSLMPNVNFLVSSADMLDAEEEESGGRVTVTEVQVILGGGTPVTRTVDTVARAELLNMTVADPHLYTSTAHVALQGEYHHEALFLGANTIEDVRSAAKAIAARFGYEL